MLGARPCVGQDSTTEDQKKKGSHGINALRAKGTLISEPRFSTPCEMRFFPREKGKNRISQGVENRGSLISVPLALRVGA